MRFEFAESGLEGWFGAGTVASYELAGGGVFRAVSSNALPQDPMMIRSDLGFRADQVPMIRVRYRGEANGNLQMFWTGELGGHSGARVVNAGQSYVEGSGFVETTFAMAGHPSWNGTVITGLRMDLINGQNLSTWVDWVRATDGDMDDDGLSDEIEALQAVADIDGDGLDNMVDRDSDGDGAPDALEDSLGRDPYAAVEDGLDADGDGQSDLFEMIVGTSPDDRADYYTQGVGFDENGELEMTFQAKPGRRYQLARSGDLTNWTTIAEVLSGSTDGEMSLLDPDPLPGPDAYYRMVVEVLD
jgi:hypothetical protein